VLVAIPTMLSISVMSWSPAAKAKPFYLKLCLGGQSAASSISSRAVSSCTAKVDLLHVPFRGGGPP